MNWTRGDTLAAADHRCNLCHGLGLRGGNLEATQPCPCVTRSIFQSVYRRWQQCQDPDYVSQKAMEFSADVLKVSKTALNAAEHKLFTIRYVLGIEKLDCCRAAGVRPDTMDFALVKLEQKLGRAYREVEPYALYPVYEYFRDRRREAA